MDIAALSVSLSSAKAMQSASLIMTKKTMDLAKENTQQLLDMMQQSAPQTPNFGHKLNIRI